MELRTTPDYKMNTNNHPSTHPKRSQGTGKATATTGTANGTGTGTGTEDFPRPISPCESEISVGCETERGETLPLHGSPMDMTEEEEEEEGEMGINSPSTSSIPRSPHSLSPRSPHSLSPRSAHSLSPRSHHSLSPVSIQEESLTYLSEDEYFRPLKRLAMSDSSPPPPPHPQMPPSNDPHSESMSSPSPSPNLPPSNFPSPHQESKQLQQQQQQQSSTPSKHCNSVQDLLHQHPRLNDDEPATEEGERDENQGEMRGANDMEEENNKLSGLRSFSILDILSYKPSRRKSSIPVKIVRPWDTRDESPPEITPTRPSSHPQEPSNNNNNNNKRQGGPKQGGQNNDRGSALDALFKMTNKTLDNLNKEDKADAVNLFNSRQPTKKKRKSRTAFTNHQIFELEKRFLYQKYLSPADRDELAQSLGLSNAQVITWFQNRRAKLKRDMEELKRDVENSTVIHNKTLLEASANVVAFLKAKELPKIHLSSMPH